MTFPPENKPLLEFEDSNVEEATTLGGTFQSTSVRSRRSKKVSSLDCERVVNQYSIQAARDEWRLPPLPIDGSESAGKVKDFQKIQPGRLQPRHVLGYTGKTATRWFLSAWAGLLTGVTSVFLIQISEKFVTWRSRNLQRLIIDPGYGDGYVLRVFLLLNLAAALLASLMCVAWVPQATSSGIAKVKAFLNGIRDKDNFNASFSLLFVKVFGTILSVGSGLAVGQEGPLIHIGAIMGSGCSRIAGSASLYLHGLQHRCCRGQRLLQRTLAWTTTELNNFATHAERRDLVSIGASCGFAASFGAPIGGLLFVLDDISSYFSNSLILRVLVANVIGTFCLAVEHGDLSNYSVINLGTYKLYTDSIFVNRVEEIPLYILTGVMGGVLGGLFCMTTMWLRQNISERHMTSGEGRAMWQLLEVALVSVLTSVLIFYMPSQKWACTSYDDGSRAEEINFREAAGNISGFDEGSRNRFFCPPGEINELANMLFGSRIEAIKRILTDPTQFQQDTLLTVGVLFYFLMTLTFGITIPSGIFTPTVLIGASLGGAAGITFQNVVDPDITPSTFALLGVAALLAGIQRSTVSVAVILIEGTGEIKILMPAIMTVVVARYVASLIYPKGIFDAVIEWKKLPYLDHEENKLRYDAIDVGEILPDCKVETVAPVETTKRLVELLRTSCHNGFPVIDSTTNKFLGMVRRDQIAALIECGVFTSNLKWTRPPSGADKTPLMRWAFHINDDRYDYIRPQSQQPEPPTRIHRAPQNSVHEAPQLQVAVYSALPTEFAQVAKDENGLVYISWLDPDFDNEFVHIGAVMNRAALVVTEFCPVSKAYTLFTAMGLRHLTVIGGESGGEVVGVLSRENLLPGFIKARTGL